MQRLGQHFLKEKRALKRIVGVLDVKPTDTIVEVGPGHGELTKHLLETCPKELVVIEKDEVLAEKIRKELGDSLKIIEGDALEVIPTIQGKYNLPSTYKLVGNIPYYITGHLIRKIGELKNKPERIVFTIQKEVAEKMCANPPDMNLFAASVKFWGEPEIIRYISRKSFKPAPRVDSAIIKITPYKIQPKQEDSERYYKFIHVLFGHPRKTILNNLSSLSISRENIEDVLKKAGVDPRLRPQNLNITTINTLSLNFHEEKV